MFALRRVAVRAFQFQPTRQLTTIRPFVSPIHQQIPSTLRALHQSRIFAEEQKTSPEEEQTEIKEDDATPDLKERVQNAAESAKETVANVAQAAFGGGVSPSANVFPSENPSPAATRSTILYVGNLLFEATPNDLEKTFSPYGVITNKRVVTDPSGRSKGFGYVEFANQEDADKAVRELDQEELAGRRMAVQYHIPRQNRLPRGDLSKSRTKNPPSSTLFIGNMSYQMSDKDLHEVFKNIENVVNVRVAVDRRTGQPRGFAHADFVDLESAQRAKEILETKSLYGRELRIDFSESVPKDSGAGSGPRRTSGYQQRE